MKKRGMMMSSDLVGVGVLVAVLVLAVIGGIVWRSLASQSASEITYRYTIAIKDKEVQLLKSGFEKTAALYSIMNTAKELGLHGGLSKKSLEKNDTLWYVKGVSPPLRFEDCSENVLGTFCPPMASSGIERIPYWVAPSTETGECGQTKERVPYLRVTDLGQNIGTIPTGNDGEAKTEEIILLNTGKKYDQYLGEVHDKKYALYVLLQVLFIKPGSVTVSCGTGCVAIERVGTTPETIRSDGIYEYKITDVAVPGPNDNVFPIKLNLVAADDKKLDGKNVARLKQLVVSIYDNAIDAEGNDIFTGNLNKFRDNMAAAIAAKETGKLSTTTINPLKGVFYRNGEYPSALVWSPDGIVSVTQDFLGNDKLLELRSSGVTEEEAKIRYWQMYDYAEKFARSAEGLLKYRMWKRLNSNFTDHVFYETRKCGIEPVCSDNTYCAGDDTPINKYNAAYVYSQLTEELAAVSSEYNSISPEGISWDVKIPKDMFRGCTANKDSSACAASENCTSDNFEYFEYIRDEKAYVGCCSECDDSSSGCGSSSSGRGCSSRSNRCTMHYDHRYILKNIRVLVTITDSKNKVFNAATNGWENLQFKFFVFIPIVDDNKCADHACDTQASPAPGYPSVSPSLSGTSAVVTPPPPSTITSPISASFTKPSGGSLVSGDVLFEVSAASTVGNIILVEFYLESENTPRKYLEAPPYTWVWSSAAEMPAPVGQHLVRAFVYDDKGNSVESDVVVNFVDSTPPAIGSVSVKDITSSSASIKYAASEIVTSKIEYGITDLYYLYSKSDDTSRVAGTLALDDLSADTTYHYKLTVKDLSGNSVSSQDATFKTLQ